MLRAGLLFWLVPITAAASGQTVAEDRTRVPMIEITEPGAGTPVILRWRPAEASTATIMVCHRGSRTMC